MNVRKLASAPLVLCLIACSGGFYRDCTSAVIGKTVETSKEVTKGVSEGIEEGRKKGESADGAVIAYSITDLDEQGSIMVHALQDNGNGHTDVVLAVSNDGDQPLRVVGVEVVALDAEGFVHKPVSARTANITIPPRAKDKMAFQFNLPPTDISVVRIWGEDRPVPQ